MADSGLLATRTKRVNYGGVPIQAGPPDAPEAPPGLLSGPVQRDPGYEYGALLPFRKPIEGGPAEWSPLYSDFIAGLVDAFSAPGRALYGRASFGDALKSAILMQTLGGSAGMLGTHGIEPEHVNPLMRFGAKHLGHHAPPELVKTGLETPEHIQHLLSTHEPTAVGGESVPGLLARYWAPGA